MPPILFHGLSQLSLPVVCVESRQAYQALKSLATHKTDRNDARGLGNQSGEVDYTGGISKCGDRWVRTLLYEAANVMLTHYKGQLKLKDWAFAIARRSSMRKARIALARRLAIIRYTW